MSGFPHRVLLPVAVTSVSQVISLEDWCVENAGLRGTGWYRYSSRGRGMMFCFADEVNATLFKLVIPRG